MLNHLPGVISQFSLLFTAKTPFRGITCQRADILADLLTVNEWAQMDGMIHNLTKSQHLRIEAPPPILLPIPDWSRPSIPFHRLARQKKTLESGSYQSYRSMRLSPRLVARWALFHGSSSGLPHNGPPCILWAGTDRTRVLCMGPIHSKWCWQTGIGASRAPGSKCNHS